MSRAKKEENPLNDLAMSKAERAPVYQTARQLSRVCWRIRKQLPKDIKYVFGTKLIDSCQGLMEAILWTYMQADLTRKIPLVQALLKRTSRVRVIGRSIFDSETTFRNLFVEMASCLDSIDRQVNGWLNKLEEKEAKQQAERINLEQDTE